MDLKEKTQQIVEVMRSTKQDWVASDPENTDIAIYLHFWRGDDLVVTVQCPIDRDTGLQAARMGAAGFGATTMSMTFESFHSSLGESPVTGKRWMPHEMQYTFETHPENKEKGRVTECISTLAHERGGDFVMSSQGYAIEDGKVVWKEFQDFYHDSADADGHPSGVMFEFLQSAMAGPTIEDRLREESEGNRMFARLNRAVTDPEVRQYHTDMATINAMEEHHISSAVVVMARKGTLRHQLLTERLGEGNVGEPPM